MNELKISGAGGVLYFGDPRGAIGLLDRGVTLVGMVHGRRGGVGLRKLLPRLVDVPRWHKPDLSDPEVVAALTALKPALLVSCFYPRRIPEATLEIAPGVNVHPSALPRWRGPDPSYWAIHEGDTETAIAVHVLETGLDEGALLSVESVPIRPQESGGALAMRLEAMAADRVADVGARLMAGEAFPLNPQVGEPTWAPLVAPDDVEIDWSKSAAEVHQLVRAASPEPGAFTGIGDELLVVFSGAQAEAGRFVVMPPGTPFVRGEDSFIRCGKGALRLGRLRLGRRKMSGKDLVRLLT